MPGSELFSPPGQEMVNEVLINIISQKPPQKTVLLQPGLSTLLFSRTGVALMAPGYLILSDWSDI